MADRRIRDRATFRPQLHAALPDIGLRFDHPLITEATVSDRQSFSLPEPISDGQNALPLLQPDRAQLYGGLEASPRHGQPGCSFPLGRLSL